MKIITYNVLNRSDDERLSVDFRAPLLKEVLAKYDPDIVGFQEVMTDWLEYLTKWYSDEYEIFYKARSFKDSEATPIMWKKDKFDCLDKGYFWFSKTPWLDSFGGCYYGCHRICMWVRLRERATDKEFYYFNTHFGFGDDYQVESVELIKQTADAMKADSFFITGDFNMQYDSPAYKRMNEYYSDANKLSSNDTYATFHGYGIKDFTAIIDYCFVNECTVKVNDSQVIRDEVCGFPPSDHYGILFDLEIK